MSVEIRLVQSFDKGSLNSEPNLPLAPVKTIFLSNLNISYLSTF